MIEQITTEFGANGLWMIALVVALTLGMRIEKWYARQRRREWWSRRPIARKQHDRVVSDLPLRDRPFDASAQLREVSTAIFNPRPLLNRSEARLFASLERIVAAEAPGWRVMAQVSLGEILASPSEPAFRAINSKRVDLLLIDETSMPLHAIEYQGDGHFTANTTAARDAVKKEALRRADIGYVEVQKGDTPAELARLIRKLVAQRLPPNGSGRRL